MSKKKHTPAPQEIENDLSKLFSIISQQKFENEQDLVNFLDSTIGKTVDEVKASNPQLKEDPKWQSQDLVYQARESTPAKARKLINQALELDPDNADALIFLAEQEEFLDDAIAGYRRALKAAEKSIGADFKQHKGHFWSIHETRPYMRAKVGLAECLHESGMTEETLKHYREMLELNPNDNQGIRYLLSGLLLEEDKLEEYAGLMARYPDDADAIWLYNTALYHFRKEENSEKAQLALLEAYQSNEWVIRNLLDKKTPKNLHEAYITGSKEEAENYLLRYGYLWAEHDQALEWMLSFGVFMKSATSSGKSRRKKK